MRTDLYLIDRGQRAHPDVYEERPASGSVPFAADLLRHPGPKLPRRRERFIPPAYGLAFAIIFGLFCWVSLISWAVDAIRAFHWAFGS